ncbi:MAG: nicotinamide mononucleotide transporter [Paludibacteraceae bacterium]|nr:nicotinamide mononucleotide transporter [Paludibacteraceae bacterium]
MREKIFDYSFIAVGLLVQVVTFYITNHLSPLTDQLSYISLLSGCLGICSVCLASQGNILTYAFGFAQVGTYMALVISKGLFGQIVLNSFYLITMIYGVYAWYKRLKGTRGEGLEASGEGLTVTPRSLPLKAGVPILIAMIGLSYLVGWQLSAHTPHPEPYLDAFTTVPALVAQVLMILVYREHWFIWLAVDILNIILWIRVGDYCMTAQYVFWCANCLYGLRRWKTLTVSSEQP